MNPNYNKQLQDNNIKLAALDEKIANLQEQLYTADATATAETILDTKTAYINGKKVIGTMPNNQTINTTLDTSTTSQTIPEGYNPTGEVKIVLEEKPVTPTKSTQSITPTSGKVLSKVTVNPIPSKYQDVTGVTAEAGNVLTGKKYVNTQGQLVNGTMSNQGAKTSEIQPNGSYIIPAGYHDGKGQITANAPGTATADKILSGETAWVGKSQISGTMPNIGQESVTIKPTQVHTISEGYHNGKGVISVSTPGNAGAGDILTGKTSWVNNKQITGTMPNQGAINPAPLKAGASYTIPTGYHNGSGTVIAKDLASQTPGTATAGDITSGMTAYVNGKKVTGTMADGDAPTVQYGRENPTLILTPNKIEIEEGDTTHQTVTIKTNSTGALSAINRNANLISTNLNEKILTIIPSDSGKIGDKTRIDIFLSNTEQFRRKIQSLNVIIVSPKLINIWGSETEIGNAEWWDALKVSIIGSTLEERRAVLGKTKKISLSTPVINASEALMQCVGYDLDGSKTLTFTTNLNKALQFAPQPWIKSKIRSECQKFYNACSAKNAILTVNKGTCSIPLTTGSNRNDDVVYNDETVFLMSERELGLDRYSPISIAHSTPDRAECTKGFNDSYQYFTDNTKRAFLGHTWTRSYDYSNSLFRCSIAQGGGGATTDSRNYGNFAPTFVVGQA